MKPQPEQDEEIVKQFYQYVIEADNGFNDDHEKFSEDCLYLNVYTTNPARTANMPVSYKTS